MRGGANPLGVIFVKEAKRGKGTYRGRNHLGATRQFDGFVDIRGDDCKSASSSSSVLYISRPRGGVSSLQRAWVDATTSKGFKVVNACEL